MTVFCLGAEQIDSLWLEVGHHLERLERETQLVLASAIRADLKASHKQLWGFMDGAVVTGVAVTTVYETPRGKACECYGAAGTETAKGQIEAILFEIERWAKSIGCTRMRVVGRQGWKRRLRTYVDTGNVTLEKQL